MQEKTLFYRIKLSKKDELSFISHLDWQNLILKIFRRIGLELVLSEGFNKMPKVSYSPALPIFLESDCELVEFQVKEPIKENFQDEFQKNSPKGIKLIDVKEIFFEPQVKRISLEKRIEWAKYDAKILLKKNNIYNLDKIRYIIDGCLASNELMILKKTKKGIEKTVNYRNSLKALDLKDEDTLSFILKAGQGNEIPALRADEFLKKLFNENVVFKIKRVDFFDKELRVI